MTYCVAIKLNAGLVFLSDSRTNAGLDQISTFRKMIIYEKPNDRFMVLLSAGNLSISQSVREILQVEQLKDHEGGPPITIWNAKSMFDAARVLGSAIRRVHEREVNARVFQVIGIALMHPANGRTQHARCIKHAFGVPDRDRRAAFVVLELLDLQYLAHSL